MAKKIEIELIRSVIGCPRWMRTIVKTLGLGKMHSRVLQCDNAAMRGMIRRIPHLVRVTEVEVEEKRNGV
jgi:large subunit ribosomal protein L30